MTIGQGSSVTYRYSVRFLLIPWFLFLPVTVLMGSVAISRGEILGGVLIISISTVLIGTTTWACIRGFSDIYVDDHAIKRSIFGFPVAELAWKDIERLTIRPTVSAYAGGRVRSFALRAERAIGKPHQKPILFQEVRNGTDAVVRCILANISTYGIQVNDLYESRSVTPDDG